MGHDTNCNVAGIGTINIKTHNGVIRTLTKGCHIPNMT